MHSFDFDPQSVACTMELKHRYFPADEHWTIEEGSVIDRDYLEMLGQFNVVYSWGVLHHTGAMYVGIENLIGKISARGQLFIAIYNDQGWQSHIWWLIKLVYNKLPRPVNRVYGYVLGFLVNFLVLMKYSLKLQPMTAIRTWINLQGKTRDELPARHDRLDRRLSIRVCHL